MRKELDQMSDKRSSFLVYTKEEISKLEKQIEDLLKENKRLKQFKDRYQELAFENNNLKNQLTKRRLNSGEIISIDETPLPVKGSDHSLVTEFIHTQEEPDVNSKCIVTTNQSPVTKSHLDGSHYVTTNYTIPDSTINSHIGYGIPYTRRQSNYNLSNKETDSHRSEKGCLNTKQRKVIDSIWSFEGSFKSKGLSELAKTMRNKENHKFMIKFIVDHWNRKPEDMTRIEFFYHLLTIFLDNGVFVTFCNEHTPPCQPKVTTKTFEAHSDVLKSFIQCINGYKLIVIEVELLVALENIAYTQPKYRPAISDIMDILFRKGVVEAVAFSEWSQLESQRKEDKDLLIREIKASGFSLIKRSSSV